MSNTEVSMETVQAMLQGSRNLDRMKSDIRSLVMSLVGLAWHVKFTSTCIRFALGCECGFSEACGGKLLWHLVGYELEGKKRMFEIECILEKRNTKITIFSSRDSEIEMNYHLIQSVHQSLPSLVNMVISGLPGMREELGVLLKASEVKFATC